MNFLYTLLAFTIVLGIIVLIHEFGHYVAARLMGVRIETFSFGFGKRLFGKTIGDTDFRVSLIPLGGYVKMAGEEEYDENNLKPDEFQAKNRAQKMFILVAGAFMNLLLAFVIFTVINITGTEQEAYKSEPPRIGYVDPFSPGGSAGLQRGDTILKIEGHSIPNWKELELTIGSNPDSDLKVEYLRNGKVLNAKLSTKGIDKNEFGISGLYAESRAVISEVEENSPASKGGIKPKDVVLEVNGTPIEFFRDFLTSIAKNPEKSIKLKVNRDNQPVNLELTPRKRYFLESDPISSTKDAEKIITKLAKLEPKLEFGISQEEANVYKIKSSELENFNDAKIASEKKQLPIKMNIEEKGNIGIRIDPPTVIVQYGFFASMKEASSQMVRLTQLVFDAFKRMIVGKLSPKNLSGPIEIAKYSKKAMSGGATMFFTLIAFISLQLGIVNLFPIPALDGGHLLIYGLEAIFRREFSMKVKGILVNIGFGLLMLLMGFVILNDVAKTLPHGWRSFWPF